MSAGTLVEKVTAAPSGRSSSGATAQPWSDGPTEKEASRSTAAPIMPLRCAAQNYAWGRPACESEVAGLVEASGEALDAGARYAELWMGTHPSAPSTLRDGSSLREWVRANPTEAMGEKVAARFGDDLPYLFKVLSVQTALSIQAHPDKALAQKLHAEKPNIYKDGNHKPEMAIAISDDFTALCSFVTPAELREALRLVPEISAVVGEERVQSYMNCSGPDTPSELKLLYGKLMSAPNDAVESAVGELVQRLEVKQQQGHKLSNKESLVLKLNQDYPLDVGILSVYFLNLVELSAGQAICLTANEPHAYLSGELVEIMATSDNVVRAGLTPKLKDVEVLLEMLTYKQEAPHILGGETVRPYTKQYLPPMDEFQLERVDIPANTSATIPAVPGPGLVLVQHGSATGTATGPSGDGAVSEDVTRGDVFFVPANTDVSIAAGVEGAKLWVANVNKRVWEG